MYDVDEQLSNHEARIKSLETLHIWGIALLFVGVAAYGGYHLWKKHKLPIAS